MSPRSNPQLLVTAFVAQDPPHLTSPIGLDFGGLPTTIFAPGDDDLPRFGFLSFD
jgi:hypothetical protein